MKNKVYTKTMVVMMAAAFLLMLSLPGSAAAMQEKEYFKLKNLNKILEKSLDFDIDFDLDLSALADLALDLDLKDMDLDIKEMVRESQEKYKEKYEEKFDKTVALAKDGKVEVHNISGDIEIKTWNRAEVKIDALKVSKASSKEKAKENADKVKIVVTSEGDLVRVETDYPEKAKNLNVSVTYVLTVPLGASPSVSTVSGDVTVADIGGDTKATAVSGEVKLGKIGGSVKAKSVSGSVIVQGAKNGASCEVVSGSINVSNVDGDISIKGVSGDIELTDIRGSVTAGTTSGEIYMKNITDAEIVKAKILSGNIRFEGNIMKSGNYDFQSHSGNVNLLIPASSAFDLEAKTFSGTIDSDFELTISGKISKKSIRGTANGGGADIEVQTFSGDVKIRKK
jgi:hypothetical protein